MPELQYNGARFFRIGDWLMAVDPVRVAALLDAALGYSKSERIDFLEKACGGNNELRRQVEKLLNALELSSGSGSSNTSAVTPDQELAATRDSLTPTDLFDSQPKSGLIGDRYKLVEKIGEGGMGEVWVAQQTEPVKRRVAVKLIRPGMNSRAFMARFEQERQALALMDHPNIAKVFDAGTTASGSPFLVMEFVSGKPLTKFCDAGKLPTAARLELFATICQAVQHAHQKGIVHRDLKPANILVSLVDGKPIPKVIDFGVAKATGGKLTNETLATDIGSIVGTLEYMAPEQAGATSEDIDTRADIYSLGVILYELLTGLRPIDGERLRKAALSEMIRIIREDDPSRPSTRLSTHESLPSLAAMRQIEPKRLMAELRGELDWVVMKCLEKSRERRYETANGLARDVQRYLANEPVEARPPSAGYRLQKLIHRNKGLVIAGGLLFLALGVGVLGTSYGLVMALRAEARANEKADEAVAAKAAETKRAESERVAKLEAQDQREKAEKRLEQIVTTNKIMGSIFEDLDINNVSEDGRSLELVLGERLKTAAGQLKGDAVGDTVVVARLQSVLGRSLMNLGFYPEAIELFKSSYGTCRESLGLSSEETLLSLDALATAYQYNEQIDEAISLFELSLQECKKSLGVDHPQTLVTMANLGDAYRAAGKLDKAIEILEPALRMCISKNGPESINAMDKMNQLAVSYLTNGQLELALPLFEKTLVLRRREYGADHPLTLTSINNLAATYMRSGKVTEAEPLFEELVKTRTKVLGKEHTNTLITMNNLGTTYQANGKLKEAKQIFAEALDISRSHYGDTHADTLYTLTNFAAYYQATEQYAIASAMYHENLMAVREQAGAESIPYALGAIQLGNTLLLDNKPADAEPLLREGLAIREKQQPDAWGTSNVRSLLGESLFQQSKLIEAEPLLLAGYQGLKQQQANIPTSSRNRLTEALQRLIRFYEKMDNSEELAKWQAENLQD
jgi:eukaryotic-like serine/threonine-protein kinase